MNTLAQYLTSGKIHQKDFADQIGTTQATVSRLATGNMTPGARLALRIDTVTGGVVPFASWYQDEGA